MAPTIYCSFNKNLSPVLILIHVNIVHSC